MKERYCIKCGRRIPQEGRFCPYCGAENGDAQPAKEDAAKSSVPEQKANNVSECRQHSESEHEQYAAYETDDASSRIFIPTDYDTRKKNDRYASNGPSGIGKPARKKRKNKWPLLIIAVAAVVLIAFVFLRKGGIVMSSVDLTKYIADPVFSGLDGEGVLEENSLKWDELALRNAIEKNQGSDRDDNASYLNFSDFESHFTLSADKTEGLSNGDEVTITITYREKDYFEEEYNVHFTGSTKVVTVKSLTEIREEDPFEDLVPTFSGVAPLATVSIDTRALDRSKVIKEGMDWIAEDGGSSYSIYKNGEEITDYEYVTIGDVLELTLNETGIRRWKDRGYKPSRTSVSYTVTTDDVESYVDKYEDINSDTMSAIRRETDDKMSAYIGNRGWTGSAEYLGSFFLTPKDGEWSTNNLPVCRVIYSYSTELYDGEQINYYFSVSVWGIKNEKTDNSDESLPENSSEEYADDSLGASSDSTSSDSASSDAEAPQIFDTQNIGDVNAYTLSDTMDNRINLYNDCVKQYVDRYVLEYSDGLEEFAAAVE